MYQIQFGFGDKIELESNEPSERFIHKQQQSSAFFLYNNNNNNAPVGGIMIYRTNDGRIEESSKICVFHSSFVSLEIETQGNPPFFFVEHPLVGSFIRLLGLFV